MLQENKGQGEEGATYCFKVEFERTRPNGTKKTQSKCIWHDAKLLAYWVGKQVRNGQDPTEPATRNPIPIKDLKILSDAFPDYFPPGFDATNRAPAPVWFSGANSELDTETEALLMGLSATLWSDEAEFRRWLDAGESGAFELSESAESDFGGRPLIRKHHAGVATPPTVRPCLRRK